MLQFAEGLSDRQAADAVRSRLDWKYLLCLELWDPDTWPDPVTLPTSAEVTLAHQRNPELTLEQIEERERESLAKRLD